MSRFYYLTLLCIIQSCFSDTYPRENIYWPGNFDTHMIGGAFSKGKMVTITKRENHTLGGSGSWEVHPGYQHLELLVKGYTPQRLSFWAKTENPITMDFKVIEKNPDYDPDVQNSKKYFDRVTPIQLKASDEWMYYEVDYQNDCPFPGPETLEILMCVHNPHQQSAFIDDVQLRETGPTVGSPIIPFHKLKLQEKSLISNGDFESGETDWRISGRKNGQISTQSVVAHQNGKVLQLGDPELQLNTLAEQLIDAKACAGKKIVLSADVGFITDHLPEFSWAGVWIDLFDATDEETKRLTPDPNPLWLPFGKAPRVGTFEKIYSTYDIPKTCKSLLLKIKLNDRALQNIAIVDNVDLRILDQ